MSPDTGRLYRDLPDEILEQDRRLVQINERQFNTMEPMTRDDRKNWMRNEPCPCGSGKKFKRCHWSNPEGLRA